MQLKTNKDVLKNILAINLDIHIWSARRKLTPEDFGNVKLPPGELASLGSKRICNPDDVKIFGTLKARAVCLLDKVGIRFLGGWAVPESNAAEIVAGLGDIQKEFNLTKESFLNHYDLSIKDWIKKNPGWEQIISNSVVDASYVAKRLAFGWQVYKVVNPNGDQQNILETGLQSEVSNMGNTLFSEVAKVANETLKRSYMGKSKVTRKALNPLRSIQQKLADLSFIEPRVAPVSSLIEAAINKLPSKGAIIGTDLLMLQGLLALINDTSALATYAQEIIDGRSQDSILDCLVKGNKPKKKTTRIRPEPMPQPAVQLDSMGLW
jgi:hypothetical protein